MAKKVKRKKRPKKYESKLAIVGSLDDVLKVSVDSAKSAKKVTAEGGRNPGGLQ
jgi:hypothetical protein